jgi:23S rRNA pseudouridine2605 synthase
VLPTDTILVDNRALPRRERTRLFLYHKPRGLLTTASDPQSRPTLFDQLPKSLPRLVSVGRLDISSEGLLLLTNDGGLARTLELPATGWLRRYRVRAHGRVTQAQLDALTAGIAVDGIRYGPIEARLDRKQGSNLWLTFGIREGKNREIRAVAGALGLQVNRLIRVSFGPFQLGALPPGGIEEVPTRILREQLGPRVAAAAAADFGAALIGPDERVPPARQPGVRPKSSPGTAPRRNGGEVQRQGKHAAPKPRASRPASRPGGVGTQSDRIDQPADRPGRRPAPQRERPRRRRR